MSRPTGGGFAWPAPAAGLGLPPTARPAILGGWRRSAGGSGPAVGFGRPAVRRAGARPQGRPARPPLSRLAGPDAPARTGTEFGDPPRPPAGRRAPDGHPPTGRPAGRLPHPLRRAVRGQPVPPRAGRRPRPGTGSGRTSSSPSRATCSTPWPARAVPAAVLPVDWWVSTRRTAAGAADRLVRAVRHLRGLTAQVGRWGCDLVYSNSSVFAAGALAAAELEPAARLAPPGVRPAGLRPGPGPRDPVRPARLPVRRRGGLRVPRPAAGPSSGGGRRPTPGSSTTGWPPRPSSTPAAGRPRRPRGRRQPFTFALVGRFRPSKGQDVAIRAFARVAAGGPAVRLLLVGGAGGTGDQAYLDHCRALAAGLGVADRVEFWGYVPDPERAFLAADVGPHVLPERGHGAGDGGGHELRPAGDRVRGRGHPGADRRRRDRAAVPGRGGRLAAAHGRVRGGPGAGPEHGAAGWAAARRRHSVEAYVAQVAEVIRGVVPGGG